MNSVGLCDFDLCNVSPKDFDLRVGIVGGGASGLFTACQLKRQSVSSSLSKIKITIFEKMPELGTKLTLTGHGRCNITNHKDASELRKGMHEASNFIYPALKSFGSEDTIDFLEKELHLKTKEEDNNRVFPECDSASRVRDRIVSYLNDDNIVIHTNSEVVGIEKKADFEVFTEDSVYHFDVVILACGGSSFPRTGSVGDSYKFASSLGHSVHTPHAGLAPVKVSREDRSFTSSLSGVSVNANCDLYYLSSKKASTSGDVLFTRDGLSGPAIMELSREIPSDIVDKEGWIELDFTPQYTDEEFDREMVSLIDLKPDTKVVNLGARFIPQSLSQEIASRAKVTDLFAQGLTRQARKAFVNGIKHQRFHIDEAPSLDQAYVTVGGVDLKEIDRKTMRSKIVEDLYVVGEALDVDGISGGYNLQACMSEAYVVSKSILG